MGEVAIDSLAGPSEVLIVADAAATPTGWRPTCWPRPSTARAPWAALIDIGGELGERVAAAVAASPPSSHDHDNVAVVACPTARRRWRSSTLRARAPGAAPGDAAELLPQVRNAGAVFVGPYAATAFADYAAGSNHVLPTGGAARFAQASRSSISRSGSAW